jgi:L-asparaginase
MMKKILCISTGGTFNKVYNPIKGRLEVDTESRALLEIQKKWQIEFELLTIIGKDSLEMTGSDRLHLMATINLSDHQDIIVVHGTDTMEQTAAYLADSDPDKRIVLTGAMVPYSIDPIDATSNFASAYGFLQALEETGIYIAMNGLLAPYTQITKDRTMGKFVPMIGH